MLRWQISAVGGAFLFGMGWLLRALAPDGRRVRGSAPYLIEAGVVLGLYALWQVVLDALVVHTAGAFSRAATIQRWERTWHLPSEAHFQRLALHAPDLIRASNVYYAVVDFPAIILALLWLFARHRDRYRHYRLTLVVLTGLCALIQAIPVAPPRLLPHSGIIDMGVRFGQSVYARTSTDPGVLITMPSVHVAWAALIATMVVGAGRSRWRWWILAHPILTMLVVVVTGNHFWADGLVAVALLGLVLAAQRLAVGLHPIRPGAPQGWSELGHDLAAGDTMHWHMKRSRYPEGE